MSVRFTAKCSHHIFQLREEESIRIHTPAHCYCFNVKHLQEVLNMNDNSICMKDEKLSYSVPLFLLHLI